MLRLTFSTLSETFAICRLPGGSAIPAWATGGAFFAITRTADELSVIAAQQYVPEAVQCSRGWRALKVEGPLDFAVVGVVASISAPLAQAGIPIFIVSTYDTDYLLVTVKHFHQALTVLEDAGHGV